MICLKELDDDKTHPFGPRLGYCLCLTLPRLPAENRSDADDMLALLQNRHFAIGMLAVLLSFMGQFTLFTYLRPFLEQVTGVNVSMLSAMLLIVGLTGLIGTSLVGKVLDGRLHVTLAVIPVAMAAVAVAMAAFGTSSWLTAGLLALWGLVRQRRSRGRHG
jgi:predicted MFS family arabinose efflux permease